MHLYKETEWYSESGYWRSADLEELSSKTEESSWAPARILNISNEELKTKLSKDFHAKVEDSSILICGWTKQVDMRRWKNFINAAARKKQFMI